jgi:hypothetical protein
MRGEKEHDPLRLEAPRDEPQRISRPRV